MAGAAAGLVVAAIVAAFFSRGRAPLGRRAPPSWPPQQALAVLLARVSGDSVVAHDRSRTPESRNVLRTAWEL
jgi:hypothetical protein